MKASLKNLNNHIAKAYPGLDIEFVKGEGYFYFCGHDGYAVESIYICYLNQASKERWIDYINGNIDSMIDDLENDEPAPLVNGVIKMGNWK